MGRSSPSNRSGHRTSRGRGHHSGRKQSSITQYTTKGKTNKQDEHNNNEDGKSINSPPTFPTGHDAQPAIASQMDSDSESHMAATPPDQAEEAAISDRQAHTPKEKRRKKHSRRDDKSPEDNQPNTPSPPRLRKTPRRDLQDQADAGRPLGTLMEEEEEEETTENRNFSSTLQTPLRKNNIQNTKDKQTEIKNHTDTMDEDKRPINEGFRIDLKRRMHADRIPPRRLPNIPRARPTAASLFSNVNGPPRNAVRYQTRVRITPGSNNEQGLVLLAEELFRALFEADPNTQIWPWRPSVSRRAITKDTTDILSYGTAKIYTDRFYPRPRIKTAYLLYFSFYISGTKTEVELKQSAAIQQFMDEHQGMLFKKEIQAVETKQLGWGLYSTPSTDGDRLTKFFQDRYSIAISCRWRPILYQTMENGKAFPTTGPKEERIYALHFETAEEDQHRARTIIQRTYNLRSTDFPLGCNMRHVPHLHDCLSARKQEAVKYLRTRQGTFLASLKSTKIYGVKDYYRTSPTLAGMNLMDLIMSIPNPHKENSTLFLSTGPGMGSESQIVVHYFEKYETVASEIATDLFPFLLSTSVHEDDNEAVRVMRAIERFFQSDVISMAEGRYWNPETLRMVGLDELQLDGLLRGEGGFDEHLQSEPLPPSLQTTTQLEIESLPTFEQEHIERLMHQTDVDSIETFRTKETNHTHTNTAKTDSTTHTGSHYKRKVDEIITPVPTTATLNPTATSISTPSMDSNRHEFSNFLAQYGVLAKGRRKLEELDVHELLHLKQQNVFLSLELLQKLPKIAPNPLKEPETIDLMNIRGSDSSSSSSKDSHREQMDEDDESRESSAGSVAQKTGNLNLQGQPNQPPAQPKDPRTYNHYAALRSSPSSSSDEASTQDPTTSSKTRKHKNSREEEREETQANDNPTAPTFLEQDIYGTPHDSAGESKAGSIT